MFISTAYAADAAPAAGGDMSMIIVLTICMVAVYFFVMRPNSKKRKEMQKLLDNLAVGDEVLTNGGIAGRISKLPENKEYVLITVAAGVEMQMKRNYVVAVLPKGTLDESIKRAAPQGKRLVKKKLVRSGSAKTEDQAVAEAKSETSADVQDSAPVAENAAAAAPDAENAAAVAPAAADAKDEADAKDAAADAAKEATK